MNDRAIWNCAFREITGKCDLLLIIRYPNDDRLGTLPAAVPLRILRDKIHSMSTQDIQRTALRAENIARMFREDTIIPANVRWESLRSETRSMDLSPGGEHITLMCEDGSLHVCAVSHLQDSVLSIPRPNSQKLRTWYPERMCLL